MAGILQHLRSSTLDKRPNPASMVDGQVAINYASGAPGMFFKNSNGDLVKVGPVHVGSSAPNASPASGGTAGNSIGEQWLDNSGGTYVFKIWDGSAWRSEAGEFVNTTGDTMTGALILPSGTAAAPALGVGSTDNGLYSPGADQVAISTNGTGRLFVDASGNVLISDSASVTSNVSTYLRIQQVNAAADTSIGIINAQNSDANATVKIQAGQFTRRGGEIVFGRENGGDWSTPTVADGYIAFSPVLDNINTERLRITSAGLVGIGTSSPDNLLEVAAGTGSDAGITIRMGTANSGANDSHISFQNSAGTQIFRAEFENSTPKFKIFSDQASDAFTILRAGNVGIGTTAPQSILHIAGSSPQLILDPGSGSTDPCSINSWRTNAPIVFKPGDTERVRIDGSGRLLVGTSTSRGNWYNGSGRDPQIQLEQPGNTRLGITRTDATNNGPELLFGKTNGSGYAVVSSDYELGEISFQGADGTELVEAANIRAYVDGTPGANDMPGRLVFSTTADGASSPTDRMTIKSDGNVGIGTTSPAAKLHIADSGAPEFRIVDTTTNCTAFLRPLDTYVRFGTVSNHPLLFLINESERMRVDTAGRLLVGTSSSRSYTSFGNARFQVEGTGFTNSSIGLTNNEAATDGSYLVFNKTRGTSVGSSTIVNSGDRLGSIWFQGADGTSSVLGAVIEAIVDGTPGANDMPGRLVFSTTADGASSPTERMRIGRTGETAVFASTTVFNARSAAAAAAGSERLFQGWHSAAGVIGGGTISFVVYTNGNVQNTNNSYGALSDIKLKENIVDANSQWDDVKALQVRNYNFKSETGQQTHTQIGLVAQEVELVSPGLVTESPDRDEDGNDLGTVTKSVNYSVLYMKAVKALQEAMERIEVLEAKVNALEGN